MPSPKTHGAAIQDVTLFFALHPPASSSNASSLTPLALAPLARIPHSQRRLSRSHTLQSHLSHTPVRGVAWQRVRAHGRFGFAGRAAIAICSQNVQVSRVGRWRHVTSCHFTSRHVMSCPAMSCHVVSCRVVSCRVVSRHAAALLTIAPLGFTQLTLTPLALIPLPFPPILSCARPPPASCFSSAHPRLPVEFYMWGYPLLFSLLLILLATVSICYIMLP